jgi:sec-independent protein translocase protein TatA
LFGSLGAPELLIILAIVVVLFGATRIGDIGKGIGRGIREFRKEVHDGQDDTTLRSETVVKEPVATTGEEKKTTQSH